MGFRDAKRVRMSEGALPAGDDPAHLPKILPPGRRPTEPRTGVKMSRKSDDAGVYINSAPPIFL